MGLFSITLQFVAVLDRLPHAGLFRESARDGVPAPTVERDDVLAHIIAALGALNDSHGSRVQGRHGAQALLHRGLSLFGPSGFLAVPVPMCPTNWPTSAGAGCREETVVPPQCP